MRHVAGRAVDGSMVTVFVDGTPIEITKIELADNLVKATGSALGKQEISYVTRGKYETEEKTFEMTKARWEEFLTRLPSNGFGNKVFPIVVFVEDPETDPLTSLGNARDELIDCTIYGIAGSYENSEAISMMVIKYKPRQIKWSGKTLNLIAGILP